MRQVFYHDKSQEHFECSGCPADSVPEGLISSIESAVASVAAATNQANVHTSLHRILHDPSVLPHMRQKANPQLTEHPEAPVLDLQHPAIQEPRREHTAHRLHALLRRERPRHPHADRLQPREPGDSLLNPRRHAAQAIGQGVRVLCVWQGERERAEGEGRGGEDVRDGGADVEVLLERAIGGDIADVVPVGTEGLEVRAWGDIERGPEACVLH